MKRGAKLILTISILAIVFLVSQISTISTISALEIKTEKMQFKQGETFFAALNGNILENVESEDVGFYRGHVQIPLTFDITKLNETYYIYALLPYTRENYTLKIKDVYYQEANKIQTSTLEKNFSGKPKCSQCDLT